MNRIAVVVALAFAGCLNPAWAENCPPGHTPSVAVVNAANSVTGSARVCADADGVNVSMDVMNLTAGHAYTVWFAYIDKASLCKVPDCSDVDWGAPNPLVVFGRMASTVAGKNDAQFSAELSGMLLSHGSQVELVILDHCRFAVACAPVAYPARSRLGRSGAWNPSRWRARAVLGPGDSQLPVALR